MTLTQLNTRLFPLFALSVVLCACGQKDLKQVDADTTMMQPEAPHIGLDYPIENLGPIHSTEEQELANETSARLLITAIGKSNFADIADDLFALDHRIVRSEFEHLLYNAMGSEIEAEMAPLSRAISDRVNEIDALVAEGDLVMLRYHITGTHTDNFYGIEPTGHQFKIPSVAMLRFDDGKIISAWFMADEVGLLRQIGQQMPPRDDGQWRLPPVKGENAQPANDILPLMLADTQEGPVFQNKLKVVTRRTSPRPSERVYDQITRRGHYHIIDAGILYGNPDQEFGGAFSDRHDKIEHIVGNEEMVAIKFRLTAKSTGPMFGLPPTYKPVDNWEVSFAWFEDGKWTDAWFFGDDMGMLHQLGGTQDYFIPQPGIVQASAITD